jgi:hypothetical protein
LTSIEDFKWKSSILAGKKGLFGKQFLPLDYPFPEEYFVVVVFSLSVTWWT